MKLPRWNGSLSPGTHIFAVVCFVIGYGIVSLLSLGQIKHDDRDGPGWNPISRMPDGKVGLSEFAIECIGFAVMMVFLGVVAALRR